MLLEFNGYILAVGKWESFGEMERVQYTKTCIIKKFLAKEVGAEKKREDFSKERVWRVGVVRDSAPRSSDGMAPPSNASPSVAASQVRRISPTPVG